MTARRLVRVSLLVALLLVVTAAPAMAHVTVSVDNPESGAFAIYTVRVPNESDTASTVLVEVQLPEGLEVSRYQPHPGWDVSLQDGVLVAEGGEIAPGQFEEFRFQARNPEQATQLSFPALQTYDDGEVAEWTGPADDDFPAPQVTIAAGEPGDGSADIAHDGAAAEDVQRAATEGSAGAVDPMSAVALAVALIALVLAGLAMVRARRG